MSESKDPAIKLFGKTIPVLEISSVPVDGNLDLGLPSPVSSVPENDGADGDGEGKEAEKGTLGGKGTEPKQENGGTPMMLEECTNPDAISGISENPKASSADKESATLTSSKTEEEQNGTSVSQEKTLKKPDKILPCPRCNSMDTKFCYYNNYNVNQPRYFCKNCQRYWTAGGTMRNVPVGAGRRKNKSSTSHYRHITVSEALQNTRTDVPNGVHYPSLKTNGTVLTFGSDTPLRESVASVLNLAEKKMQNGTENGFHKPEELSIPVSNGSGDNGINCLDGSSVTALNSKDEAGKTGSQDPVMQNCEGFPPQMPSFPGAPWPYPWNSAQWSSPVLPPAAFCPPAYPVPFYPAAAAYWGYTVPGTWSVPWLPQLSSPNHTALSSGPNSPTLGKHSRDENMAKTCNSGEEEPLKENSTERSLWIPKTLRIDDPGEAAKSSIWATLGIKNDRADSISGGGLFKAFQSKVDEKNHTAKTSPVLQANPAALSRSLNFQETS